MSSLEPTDGAKSAGEIGGAESGRRRGNDSLQSDPEVAQSWSSYAFADNNPVANIDLTGALPSDNDPVCQAIFHGWAEADAVTTMNCYMGEGSGGNGSCGECTGSWGGAPPGGSGTDLVDLFRSIWEDRDYPSCYALFGDCYLQCWHVALDLGLPLDEITQDACTGLCKEMVINHWYNYGCTGPTDVINIGESSPILEDPGSSATPYRPSPAGGVFSVEEYQRVR